MDDNDECDMEEEEVTAAAAEYSFVDWSDLHEDYLLQILKKFTSVSECLRFGSVCVSWRNILVSHTHPDLLNPQLPLLLIPTPPPPSSSSSSTSTSTVVDKEEEEETRSFYSVTEKRVYKDIEIKLPYNRHCCGSSHGWLITTGKEDTGFAVELINPFVSINNKYLKIQLPPLTALPVYEPHGPHHHGIPFDGSNFSLAKAILSNNPLTHPKDYVVMAIYSGYCFLAFWKPGDQVWNRVRFRGFSANLDVIHHKGCNLYYIVNTKGQVIVCEFGSAAAAAGTTCDHNPVDAYYIAASPIPRHPSGGGGTATETYLMKLPSADDLFMVHRFHTIERDGVARTSPHSTVGFSVFKLITNVQQGCLEEGEEEVDDRGPYSCSFKWKIMNHLENHMFFVGDNASMSFPASSEFPGGKPNHIYFTHDNEYDDHDGFVDMGVFDYKGWSIEHIHPMGSNDYILPITTIWVEPTLRCCLRF